MAPHGDSPAPLTLVLEPSGFGPEVKVRVPPEHLTELRRQLKDTGLPVSVGAEFAEHGPVLDLLIATVQTPEMWTALGASVTAFLARYPFRRIRISGNELSLTGRFGPEETEHILRAFGELRGQVEQTERDRERMKRLSADPRSDSANAT